MVNAPGNPNYKSKALDLISSDRDALEEALDEAKETIDRAEQPVILAGVEILRFNLQETLMQLVDKTNIPVAVTLLGKSAFSELHPCCLGVYEGAMERGEVRQYVETSDCLIILGAFMSLWPEFLISIGFSTSIP